MLPLSAACGQHRNSLSCLPQCHTPLTISSDTADNLLADCKNLGHYVFAAWREKGCHRQVLLTAAALDLKTRGTEKKRLLPRHQVRASPALTEAAGSKGLVFHSSKGPNSTSASPSTAAPGKAQLALLAGHKPSKHGERYFSCSSFGCAFYSPCLGALGEAVGCTRWLVLFF